MKNKPIFFLFVIFTFQLYANEKAVTFKFADSSEEKKYFDSESKTLTFYISDDENKMTLPLKEFVDIEGFSDFKNLENLSFYFPRYCGDWSFLKDAKKLKSLFISFGNGTSMDVLGELENLEDFELDYFINEENLNNFLEKDIDFSKLKKLKKFYFYLRVRNENGWYYPGRIPRFVNVQNKPEIHLDNNGIKELTDAEISLLQQYSSVDLYSNPIYKDIDLYKEKININ